MKTRILFSMIVLIAVSCTPSTGEDPAASSTPTPIVIQATLTDTPITPTASETPTTITPLAMSTTASQSVTGSVQIAGGGCCIGGTDGETIQVQVSFSAESPFGSVDRMRVKSGCFADADLESADWEPFAASKTYPAYVALNWTGFYICAQYQDEEGNLSPVYRDDISVEGMPRSPMVNPTDWYPQIQCFSEAEVHPGPGDLVTGATITFSWPDRNDLPEGVFYKVFAYGASDSFAGLAASGQTREASITLPMDPERAGEIGWYITLVDANGTLLDHGQCSSFGATLLTVDPPEGLKAVFFQYQP